MPLLWCGYVSGIRTLWTFRVKRRRFAATAGYTWPAQVKSLLLSEDQERTVLRMRELFLHNLGALMRRRQELSALLRVRR